MDWGTALERIVRTPNGFGQSIGDRYAQRLLGCTEEELATLRPLMGGRFDAFDIWNLGLYSGSRRSWPEMEIGCLARVLRSLDWLAPHQLALQVDARCPRGNDCDSDAWAEPAIVGTQWTAVTAGTEQARWVGEVARSGRAAVVKSGAVLDLWRAAMERFRFQYAYDELSDPDAVRRLGVGSCVGLTVTLADDLTTAGIPSRVRTGLLWGGLAASHHQWLEFLDGDGEWKTLDLSLALLARMFFGPEVEAFCCGSTGAYVIAYEPGAEHTVRHWCGGGACDVKFVMSAPARPIRSAPSRATAQRPSRWPTTSAPSAST